MKASDIFDKEFLTRLRFILKLFNGKVVEIWEKTPESHFKALKI